MKLIDANKLEKKIDGLLRFDGDARDKGLFIARSIINNEKEVDAIPVSWILSQIQFYNTNGQWVEALTLYENLNKWYKENE